MKAACGYGCFFKRLAAYFAGMIAAAAMTAIIAFALPTPHGPPDQAVGRNAVLLFAVFPVLSLVLGAAGLCAMIWRVENGPPKY